MNPDLEHAENIDMVFALRQIAIELDGAYRDTIAVAADRLEKLADDARWIPTSEKMPDENTYVLVKRHDGDVHRACLHIYDTDPFEYGWDSSEDADDPIMFDSPLNYAHWRPLPKLPEASK